ncbi:MAG: hypothetical protein JJD96_07790 [Thermoleophilia bacterium]|nr:hypothetical protein [Thermoleophilia bacterium]
MRLRLGLSGFTGCGPAGDHLDAVTPHALDVVVAGGPSAEIDFYPGKKGIIKWVDSTLKCNS